MTGTAPYTEDDVALVAAATEQHYIVAGRTDAMGNSPCICDQWWDAAGDNPGWDQHMAEVTLAALANAGRLRNGVTVSEVMAYELGREDARPRPADDLVQAGAEALHVVDCGCQAPDQHTPEVWPTYRAEASAVIAALAEQEPIGTHGSDGSLAYVDDPMPTNVRPLAGPRRPTPHLDAVKAERDALRAELDEIKASGRLLPEDTRRLHAEADRVHALGGEYNEAVAVGLLAAARMISEGVPEDTRTETVYGVRLVWDAGDRPDDFFEATDLTHARQIFDYHVRRKERDVWLVTPHLVQRTERIRVGPWVPVPEPDMSTDPDSPVGAHNEAHSAQSTTAPEEIDPYVVLADGVFDALTDAIDGPADPEKVARLRSLLRPEGGQA